MNIHFDEQNRIFKIDTERSSYVIAVVDEEGCLGHVYYGPYIKDTDIGYRLRLEENPFVPSKNERDRSSFFDAFPTEFPGNDVGDYRESAVEVTDEEGHRAIQFFYDSYTIHTEKPGLSGLPATFGTAGSSMTLEITLKDPVLDLELVLSYSVFVDCEAVIRSARLVNHSGKKVVLNKLMSMSLDMDDEGYQMLSLHGSWARERQMEYRSIGYGKQSVGSVRGESSHQEHPFVALVRRNGKCLWISLYLLRKFSGAGREKSVRYAACQCRHPSKGIRVEFRARRELYSAGGGMCIF